MMSSPQVLLLAFLMGVVTGLRSLTAPAAVAWAAHLNWINLRNTPLNFMASAIAAGTFSLLAGMELVADKLPKTPSRTGALGLSARIALGGLCGACVGLAGGESLVMGAVVGVAGGLAGCFGGYYTRTGLVRALKCPDFVIALLEDAVAVGGALFIVSRF